MIDPGVPMLISSTTSSNVWAGRQERSCVSNRLTTGPRSFVRTAQSSTGNRRHRSLRASRLRSCGRARVGRLATPRRAAPIATVPPAPDSDSDSGSGPDRHHDGVSRDRRTQHRPMPCEQQRPARGAPWRTRHRWHPNFPQPQCGPAPMSSSSETTYPTVRSCRRCPLPRTTSVRIVAASRRSAPHTHVVTAVDRLRGVGRDGRGGGVLLRPGARPVGFASCRR